MKSKKKALLKNTFIVAIGQICTKFITFFMLPLYTSLLSAEEYGTVDLLQTFISLIIPIAFFEIDQAIFRFLIDTRKKEKLTERLISTSFFFVVFNSIIYLLIFLLFSFFVNNQYKYFLASNVIIVMFSNLFLQICRGLGDNETYSIGSVITGAGTIVLNVLFIAVLKYGAYGMLLANLFANIFCIVFIFIKKRIYKLISIKKVTRSDLKKMLKYSLPLVPNHLSWWVINASDRTIISIILGIGINGIYSAVNKFSSILITFFNIFNITWTESVSLHFNESDISDYYSDVINTTLKVFVSFCLIIIGLMPFFFKYLIVGEGYQSGYYQIPILIIATVFNISVSLFGSIYIAIKKSNEIAKTSFYAAFINIVVNLSLIKFIGLYAASISTLVAYMAMAIYRYFDAQKYVRIKLDFRFIGVSIIFSTIIILFYYLRNPYWCIIGAGFSILFAIVYCKNIIKSLCRVFFKK